MMTEPKTICLPLVGGGDIILPSVVINLHNEAAERNDPVTTRLVKLCECWESVAVLN